MKAFTIDEMETIFEIGRAIQYEADCGDCEIEDSKEAFLFAIRMAIEFEKAHPETNDYYCELDNFIHGKIHEEFGVVN